MRGGTHSNTAIQHRAILTVGIDPGLDGAVAVLLNGKVFCCIDMPTTERASGRRELNEYELIHKLTTEIPPGAEVRAVWIEDVFSSPQMGVASAFSFGASKGAVKMMAAAFNWPVEYITPAKWKRVLRVPKDKKAACARASQLMPEGTQLWTVKRGYCNSVQAAGRAEAAMIALFGERGAAEAARL